ncbi:transcription factor bHLH53-like [Durio zibethinus]|uniref:Transcription factor bHLH53-like n=1 Tax=Durio zibethinus TaxID=66656 RepID=A0A6P5ZFK7_DURZI|nr:transcription factor bHLH53-like [Durio zibethinus]
MASCSHIIPGFLTASMVLSSYSDFGTDVQNVNSEPIIQTKAAQDQLVAGDHQLEYYCDALELPYDFLDPYINLNNNLLHPENYTPLLPYFSPYDPLVSFFPETIPCENFGSYPCLKRQKLTEDHYYCSDLVPAAFFDGVAVNSCPVPEDQSMRQNNLEGNVGNYCKKIGERCVSVQSIAARERRRKITEKTQELGKLVPGGNKMNTAEMLQSAFKYIMYLQAQVGILQVMDSFLENEKGSCKEMMQIVTSPKVQEKLYMEDKCLVPKNVVLSLTPLSKPPLSHQLSRLLAPLAPSS